MKIKHLIIAFSIIIIFIILVTALLPLMLSGPDFEVNFRYITLPLLLFMAILLISLSIFFFLNYRLLSLLEREDWPALAYYLEQKVYTKNHYNARNVRLLASSYLVISDYLSVLKLEGKALLIKPSVIEKNALIFGSARVLSGKHDEAAAFFKSYMKKCGKSERGWMRWFYSFSLLLGGDFAQAEPEFADMAFSSGSALITGLSAYFLHNSLEKHSANPDECRQKAQKGKERVVKALINLDGWKRETDKSGTDIHIAIIRKYVEEAGIWLFS